MQIGDAREKTDVMYAGKMAVVSEGVKTDKSEAVSQKDTENGNGVTVDISKQALEMMQQQVQASKDSADAMGKAAADQAKIMEIARRISRGDKVPSKDEKKLMEFDFKLYQLAKMSAMMNEAKKHKKHKSLFEDEEEDDKREMLRALQNDSASEEIDSAAADTESTMEETGEADA